MVGALRPYLDISQAVRIGDLEAFHKAMQVRLRSPPAPALLLSLALLTYFSRVFRRKPEALLQQITLAVCCSDTMARTRGR